MNTTVLAYFDLRNLKERLLLDIKIGYWSSKDGLSLGKYLVSIISFSLLLDDDDNIHVARKNLFTENEYYNFLKHDI